MAPPDRFNLRVLQLEIRPFRLRYFPVLNSTNSHSITLRRRRTLFAPTVVLCSRQLAGRGRNQNRWHAPPGTLTASFVVVAHDTFRPEHIPLIAGLAVRDAVAAMGASAAVLKWPNDVFLERRKVAGLLCERIDGIDIIGVGLNVHTDTTKLPRSIRHRVASVHEFATTVINRQQALIELARAIHARLMRPDAPALQASLREYSRWCLLTGRDVQIADNGQRFSGRCSGLDAHGRLIVDADSVRHRLLSGHVEMIDH